MPKNPILTARRHLGERLFALALRWSREGTPETMVARLEAVRAIKGLPKRHGATKAAMRRAADAVAETAREIKRRRSTRFARRYVVGVNAMAAISRASPFRGRLYGESGKSLERRFLERTFPLVEAAAKAALRYGAAGGDSWTMRFANRPADVGYAVTLEADYNTYKGRYKGWAANADNHDITVPRRWLRAVYRAGLQLVDGLLTLDAAPLLSPDPAIRLYGATWVAQGRGYNVHVHRGVIAVHDDATAYHGADAQAALRGLARKRNAGPPARRPLVAMERAARLHGDVVMTAYDAHAVGACAYGIAHWREQTGLTADTATIAQVVAGWQTYPAPEAVAAVRYAIRRNREG